MEMKDIAKVCHEANRAFCQSLGDNSQAPWEQQAPDWQIESYFDVVHFHLNNHNAPDSASHDNWMKQKHADGWKYGPEKNAEKKEHPCMVPFEDLPKEKQAKDTLFASVVRALGPLLTTYNFGKEDL